MSCYDAAPFSAEGRASRYLKMVMFVSGLNSRRFGLKVCCEAKISSRFRRLGIYFLYSDHSPPKAIVIK